VKDLDPILHQPIRTKIVVLLLSQGECDFSTLKKTLALTDGHMSTHMKLLVEEGYVDMSKEFVENKPRTTYKVSREGRKKFTEYIQTLKKIITLS
jgi:predicted transcriptional regulator